MYSGYSRTVECLGSRVDQPSRSLTKILGQAESPNSVCLCMVHSIPEIEHSEAGSQSRLADVCTILAVGMRCTSSTNYLEGFHLCQEMERAACSSPRMARSRTSHTVS